MTNKEIREKLEEAQRLLSDVYDWACNSGNKSLESQMKKTMKTRRLMFGLLAVI